MNIDILDKCIFGNRIIFYLKILLVFIIILLVGKILGVLITKITFCLFTKSIPDGLKNILNAIYFFLSVFYFGDKYYAYKKEERQTNCAEK